MSTVLMNQPDSLLPWDDLPSDERRKRRITLLMLLLALLSSAIIPFIKVPKESRSESEQIPERIARVVERKVEVPPPPPPPPKEEVKKEEPKPEEKPKEAPKPAEVTKAREKASKALQEAGLDDLASLREAFDVPAPSGGLITSTEAAGSGANSRALLTSKAGSGSGGLAAHGYSGPVSTGMGGKGTSGLVGGGAQMQKVQSSIGSGGTAATESRVGKDGKSRRTAEDIRKVFDRNGARLNNLYQRALRDDPNMAGLVALQLTVQPDGSVSAASISSSQLNNPELEAKILALVKGFNFGAASVEVWSGSYSLNFYAN